MVMGPVLAPYVHHKGFDTATLQEWKNEVRSYFGLGVNLQELYIGPTNPDTGKPLMTDELWDIVAEGARDTLFATCAALAQAAGAALTHGVYIGNGSAVAEVAVWSVALDAGNARSLWRGRSPMTVRPDALVAYYPLGGLQGRHIRDVWKSSLDMSSSGTLTYAPHPRMLHIPPFGGLESSYVPLFRAAWAANRNARLIGGGVR
jgi:hypothetical protein